LAIKISRDFV